jgi:AraC family transcriptional regulator
MERLTNTPQQTSPAALESYLACPSRRSSVGLDWGPLVVRSRIEPDANDGIFIPATPDPWLVAMTGGQRYVEVKHGRQWRGAPSGPGTVAVTSPGNVTEIRWRSKADAPIATVHIHIDAGLLHRFATQAAERDPGRIEVIDALAESDPLVESVGRALDRELAAPTAQGRLFTDAAAQLLTAHLLRRYCALPIAPARTGATLSKRKLARVRDYVEANIARPVTLDDLAGVACLSLYHFARAFKRTTGETPHDFVRRLKVEQAKRLLCETDLDIAAIAASLGYSSASHFALLFQGETGMAPAAFRSMAR